MKKLLSLFLLFLPLSALAQIGDHRNDLLVGVNAAYNFSSVGFVPKVTQASLGGLSGGLTVRYTSEKYLKTFASIYAELNYSQMGWREDIIDLHSEPVIGADGVPEEYQRRLTYVQLPLLAHLAWGRERKGCQFYFQAGPQFGYFLSESTATNFDPDEANYADRANRCNEQYRKTVENSFDYGIAAGIGFEYAHPAIGHFLLGGRYYFGLANIFGASKTDYFSKSNLSAIEIRLAYLLPLTKSK